MFSSDRSALGETQARPMDLRETLGGPAHKALASSGAGLPPTPVHGRRAWTPKRAQPNSARVTSWERGSAA
eukprot:12719570-Alexandrium_andersonii.AAC.1